MLTLLALDSQRHFPVYDELEERCAICQKIAGLQPAQMVPNPNCKNNSMCSFINETMVSLKNIPLPDMRLQFCEDRQYCMKPLPTTLNGNRCSICNQLAIHLYQYTLKERKFVLHSFCSTSKSLAVSLCGDIMENGESDFLNHINQLNDPLSSCIATHFCRRHLHSTKDKNTKPGAQPYKEQFQSEL